MRSNRKAQTERAGRIRFKQLGGECDTREWISNKQNNREFDYWLVLRAGTLDDCDGGELRFADLAVVAPSRLTARCIKRTCSVYGDDEGKLWVGADDVGKVQLAYEAGYYVAVWHDRDKPLLEMMLDGVKEASAVVDLFGCYMDRVVNGFGTTGWQLLTEELR